MGKSFIYVPEPEWTSEPPTVAGVYLYRADGLVQWVSVQPGFAGRMFAWPFGSERGDYLPHMRGEWSGPFEIVAFPATQSAKEGA